MNHIFNGMFGKLAPGMCRLSIDGSVAVKTGNGYKTYNVEKNRLTNCDNFVFHMGEEFFFVIPTRKAKVGDIILVGGKPKCVIEVGKTNITAINYEDSTVDILLPEHHVFMGNTYFYSKIVSMFGDNAFGKKKGGNKIMKYMMLKEMMKGNSGGGDNTMSNLLPLMMLGGSGMSDMFEDMFDFEEDEEEAV